MRTGLNLHRIAKNTLIWHNDWIQPCLAVTFVVLYAVTTEPACTSCVTELWQRVRYNRNKTWLNSTMSVSYICDPTCSLRTELPRATCSAELWEILWYNRNKGWLNSTISFKNLCDALFIKSWTSLCKLYHRIVKTYHDVTGVRDDWIQPYLSVAFVILQYAVRTDLACTTCSTELWTILWYNWKRGDWIQPCQSVIFVNLYAVRTVLSCTTCSTELWKILRYNRKSDVIEFNHVCQ